MFTRILLRQSIKKRVCVLVQHSNMTTAGKKRVYVSSFKGSDASGDGTEAHPFGTLGGALKIFQNQESEYELFKQSDSSSEYELVSKCQLKKALKHLSLSDKKAATAEKDRAVVSQGPRSENGSTAIATTKPIPDVPKTRIQDAYSQIGKQTKVYGWVSFIRRQGKNMMFFVIRDGTGSLQCFLANELCHTSDALRLTTESTVCVYGTISNVPEGKTAPGNVELVCDTWQIISEAPPGGIDAFVNEESNPDTQLNYRHLYLRTQDMTHIMKIRSATLYAFRDHYKSRGFYEITPPTFVQTQCEGGSTLFKLNYFDQIAFLTQSSQLYLETVLPSLGSAFCIAQSFRAETSRTRRHLAEYTHIEAELPFIDFNDLLNSIEDLVCDVLDRILSSEVAEMVKRLNPQIKSLKRPFKRMLYTDALEYLKENGITKDDGTLYEFGDDIPEAPERKMIDKINEPVFLIKFPAHIKAFYMKKDPKDLRLTESVDLLLPGVGEVVGGSMRMSDEQELLEAYRKEGVDASPYFWYTDQRKFGSCEHGGYGLGLERYLTWLTARYHIRDVCLYPRFVGRCTP